MAAQLVIIIAFVPTCMTQTLKPIWAIWCIQCMANNKLIFCTLHITKPIPSSWVTSNYKKEKSSDHLTYNTSGRVSIAHLLSNHAFSHASPSLLHEINCVLKYPEVVEHLCEVAPAEVFPHADHCLLWVQSYHKVVAWGPLVHSWKHFEIVSSLCQKGQGKGTRKMVSVVKAQCQC